MKTIVWKSRRDLTKSSAIISGLVLFLVLTASDGFGQKITLTTTSANIVATPTGNTARLNPHPIGAWYYNDKWNIFNTDHANLSVGLNFKIEVFFKT